MDQAQSGYVGAGSDTPLPELQQFFDQYMRVFLST
ncbi:unnamed protein product, partial [marine sediment metagenome]